MKKKAERALKNVGLPILLSVAEGATENQHLRGFSVVASTGEDMVIISNIQENGNKSPFDGVEVAANNVSEEQASSSEVTMDQLADYPVIAHCDNCNHNLLSDKKGATALDGVSLHCISCGEEVTAEYFGDFASDDSEDESSEEDMSDSEDEDTTDDSEDDSDSEDYSEDEDMSDSEDDSEDDDVSEEEAGDDSSDEPDESNDSSDDSSDDSTDDSSDDSSDDSADDSSGDSGDDSSDESSDESEDAACKTAAAFQSVIPVAACVEDLASPRLIFANEDRVEVFAGDTHIGYLNLQQANDTVRKLAKTSLASLARAFTLSFHKEMKNIVEAKESADLSNFGFVPATIKVNSTKIIEDEVQKATTAVEATLASAIAEESEAFNESMNIAIAGLNKGVLEGPNMVKEFAETLKKYGVKNPVNVAAATVEKIGEPFLKAAIEHAANIRKEGVDYARGLSRSISTAGYVLASNEPEFDVTQITAAVHNHSSTKTEPVRTVRHEEPKPYRGLFKRMR